MPSCDYLSEHNWLFKKSKMVKSIYVYMPVDIYFLFIIEKSIKDMKRKQKTSIIIFLASWNKIELIYHKDIVLI